MSGVEALQLDPELADIQVVCPIPGQEHEPMRLGDFAETERGSEFIKSHLETAKLLEENAGMDKETALAQALGSAVVRTETGDIARVTENEASPAGLEELKKN